PLRFCIRMSTTLLAPSALLHLGEQYTVSLRRGANMVPQIEHVICGRGPRRSRSRARSAPRPRRSSTRAAFVAAFIASPAAIVRYRRRRITRTVGRAKLGPASSTCSVHNRPRQVAGLFGRSALRARKSKLGCRTLFPPARDAGADGRCVGGVRSRSVPVGRLEHQQNLFTPN